MREVKVVFDVPGVTVAVSVQKRNDKNKGAYICHYVYEVGDDENEKTNLFSLPLNNQNSNSSPPATPTAPSSRASTLSTTATTARR